LLDLALDGVVQAFRGLKGVVGVVNLILCTTVFMIMAPYVLAKLQVLRKYYTNTKSTNEKSLFASLADVHPFS